MVNENIGRSDCYLAAEMTKSMEHTLKHLKEFLIDLADECIDLRNKFLEEYDKIIDFKSELAKPQSDSTPQEYNTFSREEADKEVVFTPDSKIDIYPEKYFVNEWVSGKAGKILKNVLQENEPFVVFRAKDLFTPFVLNSYIDLIEQFAPEDYNFLSSLVEVRKEIKDWQRKNRYSVRFPD